MSEQDAALRRGRGRKPRDLSAVGDEPQSVLVKLSAEEYRWLRATAEELKMPVGGLVSNAVALLRKTIERGEHGHSSAPRKVESPTSYWSRVKRWAEPRLHDDGYITARDIVKAFGVAHTTALRTLKRLAATKWPTMKLHAVHWTPNGRGQLQYAVTVIGSEADADNERRLEEREYAQQARKIQRENYIAARRSAEEAAKRVPSPAEAEAIAKQKQAKIAADRELSRRGYELWAQQRDLSIERYMAAGMTRNDAYYAWKQDDDMQWKAKNDSLRAAEAKKKQSSGDWWNDYARA